MIWFVLNDAMNSDLTHKLLMAFGCLFVAGLLLLLLWAFGPEDQD